MSDDGYGRDYGGHESRGGREGQLTRTRLPEGEGGDPYRQGRRGGRTAPSRNLLTVVAVVVLLIAAIAFANRGGGSSGSDDGQGGADAQGQPTAPTGQQPVSGGSGGSGKNGASGVASGFPKSDQGAQSAAANYAVALGSADMVNPDRRHQLVARLFTKSAASDMQAKLDRAYTADALKKVGLDKNGKATDGTYISRTVPVGTKTTAYHDGGSATVAVWCTGVFGTAGEGSTNPVANDWFTMTVSLRWSHGDWKVTSFSQKDGPAPVDSDRAASSADEISKAVEQYGGFTYAR